MASFNETQLEALRKQCVQAISRGYQVAHIDQTINTLADETGVREVPKGVRTGSVEHLLSLVLEAKAQLAGKPKPVQKTEPKKPSEPKREPKPEAETTPEPEPVVKVPETETTPEPEPVVETPEAEKPVEPGKKTKKRRF